MADEQVVDDKQQQVDPAIEAEARRGGWQPKDRWHGDPAAWVDAPKFVERGKELAPHLARTAEALRQENARLATQGAETARQLAEMKTQVEGLTTFKTEMATRERERIREELVNELAVARQAGDFATEARILGKLATPPPAPEVRQAPVVQQPEVRQQPTGIPQEMTDWVAANDWYKRDPVLSSAMNIVGAEMRTNGQLTGMSLTDQLNFTAKEVLKRYAPPGVGGSRVEGGRSSGEGGGGRQPATEGWESLPANIKAECDAQGERLGLVGEKKTFKTKEAWRVHYAKEYLRYSPGAGYDFRPPGN